MHRPLKLILNISTLVCFLTAGCATKYQEPPHTDSTNPFIEAVAPVWIVRIDDQPVSRAGFTGDKKFAVSPGKHLLELQYLSRENRVYENRYGQRRLVSVGQSSGKKVLLTFIAVTEKHYYVHAGVEFNLWNPYINETPPDTFADLPAH